MKKPRVSPKIPTHHIEFVLNRMHVGTSNRAILRNLRDRMKGWTKSQRFQAYRYAMWHMESLRGIYSMTKGSIR